MCFIYNQQSSSLSYFSSHKIDIDLPEACAVYVTVLYSEFQADQVWRSIAWIYIVTKISIKTRVSHPIGAYATRTKLLKR